MDSYHFTAFDTGLSSSMGYRVISSEPRQTNSHATDHLGQWVVDALVSEFGSQPVSEPGLYSGLSCLDQGPSQEVVNGDTWTDKVVDYQPRDESQLPLSVVELDDVEEDIGIRLVHSLLMCAEAIQCSELQLANSLINEMTNGLMTRVNMQRGIGKVASYFVDALTRRLYEPGLASGQVGFDSECHQILYHHFYEACPYIKFAHFTANQAILEAFSGHDCVHVIDFSLLHGLQWPALIQALALRPGGPPSLKLTAISPASTNRHEVIGSRLAQLARSVKVKFSFRVVTVSQLEVVKPWILHASHEEAVAINSILHLHRLLSSNIEQILEWIRSLNPKIVTVVEQEANHNQPEFLARFTEALHYYSTVFDSLEACQVEPAKPLAEIYIQREICNILCCEGQARVERHEPLAKWRIRLSQAGFEPLNMGQNAFKQASMLLTLFSAEGYNVQESDGCLTLGWHDRPLIAASAWQVKQNIEQSHSVFHDRSSSSSSSA